jgi:7-keto-8-aminopelargonate synthetase-like enzyme
VLEAEPERVRALNANASALREALHAEGLPAGGGESQIVPLEIGDAGRTMELCGRLLERGVFAQGIRPPTVPAGSSRLRFSVMATHEPADLREAARSAGEAARELGVATAQATASLSAAA